MSASRAPFKLRSTCDACSTAKVKCDKKQPACDRCRTNGLTCSYSPSRRHGKHSWKNFSEFNMTSSGLTLASEPVMDVDSGDGQAVSGSGNESGGGDDATFMDFNNALGDGFEVNSNWTALDLGIAPLSSGFGIPDDIQGHNNTGNVPDNNWDGASSVPTTAASSVFEAPQPRAAPYDCEAEAFTALHSLHSCSMLHADHSSKGKQTTTRTITRFGDITDHMPPLDKVLYFNRAAINTLKELLSGPCVQQPHLTLLYMTIASKVLFWYRLVVSSHYQPKSKSAVPSLSSNSSSIDQTSPQGASSSISDRAVKPVSFQIGVFDLGDEDQKSLMKVVLLKEVRRLEGIVSEMKRLGDEHGRDDEYHDEQHVLNWYAVAGTKMQSEVQDTLRQIKDFGNSVTSRDG